MMLTVMEGTRHGDAAIDAFLTAASRAAAALVIEGEAGIGKTTQWLLAQERAAARGFRVLTARAASSEVTITYGVLADLLAGIDPATLDNLPEPQRQTVDQIVRHATTATPGGERLVAASLLAALERMAEAHPVIVAIDDVQWLDGPSRAVLEFVVRRIKGRIGVLATVRTEPSSVQSADWIALTRPEAVTRIRLRPLSLGALHRIITERIGVSLSRPALTRITEVSGGNPLYALELARMSVQDPRTTETRLPESLTSVVAARLGELDAAVRPLLLMIAADPRPTVDIVARACQVAPDELVARLRGAEDAGLIRLGGQRVGFDHPLMATGIYAGATAAERRAAHRALATVLDDPELRARHLALAATSDDPDAVAALDAAAAATAARGAPSAAGQLLEIALTLGGDSKWRRLQAAAYHYAGGDAAGARAVLEPVAVDAKPGLFRSMALSLLAGICCYDEGFAQGAVLLQQAQADCPDPAHLLQILLGLAVAQMFSGEVADARHNVQRAVALAEEVGVPVMISQALGLSNLVRCVCGEGVDEDEMRRAVELDDPAVDVAAVARAGTTVGLTLSYIGQLDEARTLLRRVRQRCAERGAENDVMTVTTFAVLVEIWRGDLAEASALIDDAVERAQQLGGENTLAVTGTARALLSAYTGDEADCRRNARQALEISRRHGSDRLAEWPVYAQGFLELSLGDHAACARVLRPLIDRFGRDAIGPELGSSAFLPDAIEALVALGELDEADRLITAAESAGRRLDRPWILVVGARGRALWLAARGELPAALDHAQRALTEQDRLAMPFERARTLLLLGQLQRRARRSGANVHLADARALFDEIGTPLWSARAAAEQNRGQLADPGAALTGTEHQTATLAAEGLTNRDIAGVMFVSEKTVESNLTRVYRKLGIRSRAELGRRLDEFAG